MRKTSKKQMPSTSQTLDHPRTVELSAISRFLDNNSNIGGPVMQDLLQGGCLKRIRRQRDECRTGYSAQPSSSKCLKKVKKRLSIRTGLCC